MEKIYVRGPGGSETFIGILKPYGDLIPAWSGSPIQKYAAIAEIGRHKHQEYIFETQASARFWLETAGAIALSH